MLSTLTPPLNSAPAPERVIPCRFVSASRWGGLFCGGTDMPKYDGKTYEERFWSHVRKSDGCWEWIGANTRGYGSLWMNGRHEKATKISWQINCGPVPAGMWLLHRCDNPPCVRPDHLFLGTVLDNARDAAKKGRLKIPPTAQNYAKRTHCSRGHKYVVGNMKRHKNERRCNSCQRIRWAKRYYGADSPEVARATERERARFIGDGEKEGA